MSTIVIHFRPTPEPNTLKFKLKNIVKLWFDPKCTLHSIHLIHFSYLSFHVYYTYLLHTAYNLNTAAYHKAFVIFDKNVHEQWSIAYILPLFSAKWLVVKYSGVKCNSQTCIEYDKHILSACGCWISSGLAHRCRSTLNTCIYQCMPNMYMNVTPCMISTNLSLMQLILSVCGKN